MNAIPEGGESAFNHDAWPPVHASADHTGYLQDGTIHGYASRNNSENFHSYI